MSRNLLMSTAVAAVSAATSVNALPTTGDVQFAQETIGSCTLISVIRPSETFAVVGVDGGGANGRAGGGARWLSNSIDTSFAAVTAEFIESCGLFDVQDLQQSGADAASYADEGEMYVRFSARTSATGPLGSYDATLSAAGAATVTVPNAAPTAEAGTAQTVTSGTQVTLAGSGTDTDGTIASYLWTRTGGTGLEANAFATSTDQNPTFTDASLTSNDTAVTHEFSLVVTDDDGAMSIADTVTVTINPPANAAPTAEAGTAQAVTSGDEVTLTGSGTDTDGTIASYLWTRTGGSGDVGNAFETSTDQNPTFTDASLLLDSDLPVTHEFSLVVTDDDGATSEADTVTITINPPADTTPPEQATGVTATANADSTVTVSGNAEEGATVMVTFPDGSTQEVVASDGTFTVTSAAAQPSGDITVVVVDGAELSSEPLVLSVVAGMTVAETQEQIANFMQSRASQVIAAQPDLVGLLSGSAQGSFNANASQSNGSFDVATGAGYPVWARLQGSWSEAGDAENSYFFGVAGAHYAITPDTLVGLMLEFDSMTQDDGDVTTDGNGYLVGPYFVAKLPEQPLYFEGRYLVGQTENEVTDGDATVAAFDTERTLASVKVAGELNYGLTVLTPSLSATQFEDEQKAFTDEADRDVAAQSITVTDVALGLDFATPLPVQTGDLVLTGGFSAIMSETSGSGFADTVVPSFDGERARVHLGSRYTLDTGMILSAGANYDGIGTDDYESFGLALGLEMTF